MRCTSEDEIDTTWIFGTGECGSVLRIWGSGSGIHGLCMRVEDERGLGVWVRILGVWGSGFGVWCLRFRGWGMELGNGV